MPYNQLFRPRFLCGIVQVFGFGKKDSIACNIVLLNKFVKKLLAVAFQFGIAVKGGRVKSQAIIRLRQQMNMNIFHQRLSAYLERIEYLLKSEDEVQLTYCALELRRSIELIIWKQFSDTFSYYLSQHGMYWFSFTLKLQSQSVSKMHKLLKKHIRDYAKRAERDEVTTHLSAVGSAPLTEDGKVCFITPSLPTSDYDYLSQIIHYEKEMDSDKYRPVQSKLKEIYNKLRFIKDNYTFPILSPNVAKEMILENFKQYFGFTDESIKSFPL